MPVSTGELGQDLQQAQRRRLLAGFALLATNLATPAWAQGAQQAADFWIRPRKLRLRHASGETIEAVYWSDGELDVPQYTRVSYFLRDRVTGTGVYAHPVLLDILYGINGWLDYFQVRSPVLVHSAYRDPLRNLTIEGAARNSRHTRGEAVDISIPGVSALQVSRFGLWLGGGGVGWYPQKRFTHLDRGRLRAWQG